MSLNTVKFRPKYGLIKKGQSSTPGDLLHKKIPKVASYFEDENDEEEKEEEEEEEGTNKERSKKISSFSSSQMGRNQISNVNKLIQPHIIITTSATSESAAAADSSIYDYDGQYDSFKQEALNKQHLKSSALNGNNSNSIHPQYITNLMSMAKIREKEKERIYERKLLKERQVEDAQFGDQPKFITSAYKQKLLEEKKWNYEDRLTEEIEKRTDVRGKGMEGFYAGLLTRNIAMGSDVSSSAISAYTAGSQRQRLLVGDDDNNNSTDNMNKNKTDEDMLEINEKSQNSETIKRKRIEDDDDDDEGEGNADNNDDDVSMDKKYSNEDKIETNENNLNIPPISSSTVPKAGERTVVDKTAVVMSARERYLARKLQQNNNSNNDNSS